MTEQTTAPENPAQTMLKAIENFGPHADISTDGANPLVDAALISLPKGRDVHDITSKLLAAREYLKPSRRKGTAKLTDLDSLIAWANRFKGPTSALFANPNRQGPSLTCIADYHASGPVTDEYAQGDPTARHCHHRAVYSFPLSDEWKAWTGVDGSALDKDEMGEFIEANAKDVMDPTPPVLKLDRSDKNQDWENRLIDTARQIEGRYGQLTGLLAMSRQFQVHETSNLTVTSNRDTGEQSIQFLNEHKDKDGAPINIPNLIIIAIPVFYGGQPFRMPVRFRYRKMGGTVKFIMSIYNPDRAMDLAFDEAITKAKDDTDLPLFKGQPES